MNEQTKCPKCHDIGIALEHVQESASVTTTVKWCDCPVAKRHIAGFRSQVYPKARIALLQRDFMERMAHLFTRMYKPHNLKTPR